MTRNTKERVNEQRRMLLKLLGASSMAAGAGAMGLGARSASAAPAESKSLPDPEDMGPLKYAKSTDEELIPGMREQGKGLKINVESDYAPMKATIVGNPSSIFIPDPDKPEMKNLLGASAGNPEFMEYMRKNKGRHLAVADPEVYEKMRQESDALAKAYRDNGVRLLRNETYTLPKSLIDWQTSVTGDRFLSLYGGAGGNAIGNCFLSVWEVGCARASEMQHRDPMNYIMEHDENAVWLTMPHPAPTSDQRLPEPFMSGGDIRMMPDKLCLFGIGVTDPSHITDRSKPRSSGTELGAEVLRRMMKPYGWRVETVYFNSKYTYHIDCLMMMITEGIYGLPKSDEVGPALWTKMPKEIADWEVIDIDHDEQYGGVCNSVCLGNRKVVMEKSAVKTADQVSGRGVEPVLVPYSTCFGVFHSGLHCSTGVIWAES